MVPLDFYLKEWFEKAASALPGLWPFGPDGFLAQIADLIQVVLGILF